MKGRAQAPSSPESEESWTVDCPCGVNFDDGEEMVDCDECGVWVHTSCCRVLKGHTSYVCDKCKYKKKKESEESEVAQLLVELPSKAPPLEEKVFTLRTDLPIEERVHVQGVPGGDPSFFVGVSPVFSRQLWKSTGYVPKAFQFNYNEFPEWLDDKMGGHVLFGDLGERRLDSLDPTYTNHEEEVEEEKLLDIDMPPSVEVQADGYYLSKENYNKREFKKESKHGHKLQEDGDLANNHHNSKRRRDENGKGFTSKKRSKTYMLGDYRRTRTFDEAAISLKSSRSASKNAKDFEYTQEANVVTNSYGLREHGTQGFAYSGSTFEEAGVGMEMHAKNLATKSAKKNPIPILCSHDNTGSNGGRRSPNPVSESVIDTISPQEAYYQRRQLEGGERNKVQAGNDLSANKDASRPKEQPNDGGYMKGKSSCHLPDSKEHVQRVPLNVLVRGKDQVEEAAKEEVDPSPRNKTVSQDPSPKPIQVGASVQPGKHHTSEEASSVSRQRSLSQKQSDRGGLGMGMGIANNNRQQEPSLTIAIKEGYERHDQMAYVSDDEHMEEPCSINFGKDINGEDLSMDDPEELRLSQDDLKHQDAVPLTTPSTVHHTLPPEANTSLWAVSHCMAHNNNMKLSPMSGQTEPSKSAEMSSPTISGPGVDSRQHHGFTKMDSVSPPADRNPTPQPGPPFKSLMGSPNKVYTLVASKGADALHAKSNSSSKHRSRVHDVKKVDATKLSSALEELDDRMSLPSRKESKEPTKVLEGKMASTVKSLAGRAALHSKAHAQPISAAKLSSLDSGEQTLMQSKRPLSTTMSNKTGLKNTVVVISSSHGSTVDAQLQGMDSTCNDEELALLLHQELNSSPRVSRVARFRQGGSTSHPLSTKRPATTTASSPFQKDSHTMFRRKNREDSQQGEVAFGFDDAYKNEMSGGPVRQDGGSSIPHSVAGKDKDSGDSQRLPLHSTPADLIRHLSPGPGVVMERYSDFTGPHDADDGEMKASADNILTLPGLIEEILNEKGLSASYDLICEEVLPHWSKLRKHNGERYAYTSHRQAVLDCLRNRSAWSHLIDRGPKTNLGRKRRRSESVAVAVDSESAEHTSRSPLTRGEDNTSGKLPKEAEVDGMESWQLSDGNNKDATVHEEVPKGKRKLRRGRRLTSQSRGHRARARGSKRVERMDEPGSGVEDSPGSDDAVSTSEDDEIYVHRGGAGGRHVIGRHRASSVDTEDDDDDDDTDG